MAEISNNVAVDRTMPDLKYLIRVKAEIPVIKLGYDYVKQAIDCLKESSTVVEWSLNKATSGVDQVVKYPLPYIRNQLLAVDQLLCTTLDLAELNLPVVKKTPQEVYEESVDYVLGIITPITDWVDVELLPPAEFYVDNYLPELDPDQKIKHVDVDDGKCSRACQLILKLNRRVKQHAYAEPKYLGSLICRGYEELVLLMKITFHQIWKKLGDGVTPNEEANSVLLVEMGYIRLRKFVSLLVQLIEISEEMTTCYIKMLKIYVNFMKNYIVDNLSRIVNPATKKHLQNIETLVQHKNVEIQTIAEITSNEPSNI